MSLIACIPINHVKIDSRAFIKGFEGFVLIWGITELKIYKEIK